MSRLITTLGLFAVLIAAPATAVEPLKSDLAYAAIASRNWTEAETQLRTELAQAPDDAMRMVNLAFVLQQQGRDTEAAEMYRKVLEMKSNPKVAVGSDDRNLKAVRVKSIANKGIASIEGSK
ncbi:MAG: tetratricopeptide repeat protein [Rhodospirillaceae bacterium]|nr:tetratricopeptide repeat protein [Rhodospirillaceae bacterium]